MEAGRVTHAEINGIISDITGARIPKLRIPDALVILNARLLTAIADVTKRPPLWDMSLDQMRTMKAGLQFEGRRAAQALGFTYTPVRTAFEDAIASYQAG